MLQMGGGGLGFVAWSCLLGNSCYLEFSGGVGGGGGGRQDLLWKVELLCGVM